MNNVLESSTITIYARVRFAALGSLSHVPVTFDVSLCSEGNLEYWFHLVHASSSFGLGGHVRRLNGIHILHSASRRMLTICRDHPSPLPGHPGSAIRKPGEDQELHMFTCHLQIRGAAGGVDREFDVGKLLIAAIEDLTKRQHNECEVGSPILSVSCRQASSPIISRFL